MYLFFFFFNDTATTEIYTWDYTLSLHDALPISVPWTPIARASCGDWGSTIPRSEEHTSELQSQSHISYAVFCLKKKNPQKPSHKHYYTKQKKKSKCTKKIK